MSQVTNKVHVYEEPFDVDSIPTPVLIKAAAKRKRDMRAKGGPWASLRKLSKCPYCRRKVGVRQGIKHRQNHRAGKPCPVGRESYAK